MDEHFHPDSGEWSARLGRQVAYILFVGLAVAVVLVWVALGIWAVRFAL